MLSSAVRTRSRNSSGAVPSSREVSYRASASIEVVDEWKGIVLGIGWRVFAYIVETKFTCHAVEMVGLFGVSLVKTLGSYLEFEVFHYLVNKVSSFISGEV